MSAGGCDAHRLTSGAGSKVEQEQVVGDVRSALCEPAGGGELGPDFKESLGSGP